MSSTCIRTNPIKFAIMIPMSVGDHVYVTKTTGTLYKAEPALYNTKQEAEAAATVWGNFAKVVEYQEKAL